MAINLLAFVAGLLIAASSLHAEEPMKVTFKVVPYASMRYPTVGDWQFTKRGNLRITVARMSNPSYEDAIGLHEFVEAVLCKAAGVTQDMVDAFDNAYKGDSEPGDNPDAPYHEMHVVATAIERELIAFYGLDWDAYSAEVESLGK